MDCTQINDAQLLVQYFQQHDEARITRVLNCFYELYFEYVSGCFKKTVFSKWSSTRNKEIVLSREAFNDGLLEFYLSIRKNGFYEGGATVKSLFTTFCIKRLFGLVSKIVRNPETYVDSIKEEGAFQDAATQPQYIGKELEEKGERRYEIYERAKSQLDARSATLIQMRKIEKLSNEEIAGRLKTIDPGSVNNEVYKSFQRLKKIVDSLKKDM